MIKPWIREHRKQSRVIVMDRAKGQCESCGKRARLEFDHVCGRGHLISEPWASSHYLTIALCSFCHREATDERRGMRAFTRRFCIPALAKLAREQGVSADIDGPDWNPLDEIRAYVRVLKYPDAG